MIASTSKPSNTEIDPAGNTGGRESPPLPISNPAKEKPIADKGGVQINGNVRISSPRALNVEAIPVGTPVPRRPKDVRQP